MHEIFCTNLELAIERNLGCVMEMTSVLSYLTSPGRNLAQQPEIGEAKIPGTSRVYEVVQRIFEEADRECNIPICFSSPNGNQNNECRSYVLDLLSAPQDQLIENGRPLAQRLQQSTMKNSGLGLLFIAIGRSETEAKIVLR